MDMDRLKHGERIIILKRFAFTKFSYLNLSNDNQKVLKQLSFILHFFYPVNKAALSIPTGPVGFGITPSLMMGTLSDLKQLKQIKVMKKILYCSTLMLAFYSGYSQMNVNQSSEKDLQQFKRNLQKEHFKEMDIPGTVSKNTCSPAAFFDYGNPPDWSNISEFGGSGKDNAREIVSDDLGNIYITGSFSGDITVSNNTLSSLGHWDAFVAKFQKSGAFAWIKQFSSSADGKIESNGIHIDNAGNIFCTGYYSGNASIGSFNLYDTYGINLFYAKLNNDGEILSAAGLASGCGMVIDTDLSGNIYIVGTLGSTTNSYINSSIILKCNSAGVMVDQYESDQNFCDMEIGSQHIYFTGTVSSAGYIGSFYLDPVSYGDAFIAKSDLSFNFEWANMAGHENYGDSYGEALFLAENEDLYFTGYFRTSIVLGQFQLQGYDGFVAKCSTSGQFLWLSHASEIPYWGPHPADICMNGSKTCVISPGTMVEFNSSNGTLLNTCTLDYSLRSIAAYEQENKINLSAEKDQIINIVQLNGNLAEEWSFEFEGNSAFGDVIGLGTDQFGFVYLYGYASNDLNYYGTSIGKGLFLAKHAGDGSLVWIRLFPEGYEDYSVGSYLVTDTISNYVYITGNFYEPLVIPGITILNPAEWGSIFILKYDFEGNYVWSVQEDFNGHELTLSADHSGNILLCGCFEGTINIGNTSLEALGGDDFFISKYNPDGNFTWALRAGGDDMTDWECFITNDAADNVYFTGEVIGTNFTLDDYPLTLNEGDGNIVIAKINPNGIVQWATSKAKCSLQIGWGDDYSWPSGIHADPDGNCYIKGWHGDSTYFDNIMLRSPYGNMSKFIAKFNTNGNTIWAKSIEEKHYGMDYNQMDIDQAGNVYFGMAVRDTIYFEDDFMYTNTGVEDIFVAKYTSEGELDWVKTMAGSFGINRISGVAVSSENTLFVGGLFNNSLDFQSTVLFSNNQHGFLAHLGGPAGITVYKKDSNSILFNVNPNPGDGHCTIQITDDLTGPFDIIITDLAGREVDYYKNQTQKTLDLDLTGIPKGMYIIKLRAANRSGSKKILIQ